MQGYLAALTTLAPAFGLVRPGAQNVGTWQPVVEVLVNEYHCNPQHILSAVGPSIGPRCYQISATMADEAVKELSDQECIKEGSDGSIYFNLWKANEKQLKDSGIKEDHLHRAGICTSCNVDLFFSYRKEKSMTGRFGALIGLRE